MKRTEIKRGGLYVGKTEFSVREVHSISDELTHYHDYNIDNGSYFGHGACSVGSLARWAHREATADEAARLQRNRGADTEMARSELLLRKFLMVVPDEWIIAEAHRRGLTIVDDMADGDPR